jgi:formylglycine-generating enzyme required for sulfatase activity
LHCPNQWGLYDTYGNVEEYVWEWREDMTVGYDFLPAADSPDRIDERDGLLIARGGMGTSPIYSTGSSSLSYFEPGFELVSLTGPYLQGVRLVRTATDEDLANFPAANE